jgi:hypothetical protein
MRGRALGVTSAVLLLAAGCGGSSDDTGGDSTATTTTTEATTETATTETVATTTQTTTAAAEPTVISITVAGAQPSGGIKRVSLKKGDRAVISVTSDVADEIHFHGYDLSADVEAGGNAKIPFTATTVGRFEVELEERKVLLAEIDVTP